MFKASLSLCALALATGLAACSTAPQQDAGTQVAAVTERQCVTDRGIGSNLMKKDTCNSKLAQAQDQRAMDKAAMEEMKRNSVQPTDMGMHR